ncbi:MAG: futalosine hydrolase [Phycisphaeraceae bacterium]|nr:futalosine hydrolase [Phycisphaeraceae bacterium]
MKPLPGATSLLFVTAARKEAAAVLDALGGISDLAGKPWVAHPTAAGPRVVATGVGKAASAGGTAWVLDPTCDLLVVNLGVAGSLPGSGVELGDVVIGTESVFADEGLVTDSGFLDIAALGFPPIPGASRSAIAGDVLGAEFAHGLGAHLGPVATVSTCSGTDGAAKSVAARTGALAEAMEGGAVGVVCARAGVRFVEIRVISNTTGDRQRQVWALDHALDRLGAVAGWLATHLNRGDAL